MLDGVALTGSRGRLPTWVYCVVRHAHLGIQGDQASAAGRVDGERESLRWKYVSAIRRLVRRDRANVVARGGWGFGALGGADGAAAILSAAVGSADGELLGFCQRPTRGSGARLAKTAGMRRRSRSAMRAEGSVPTTRKQQESGDQTLHGLSLVSRTPSGSRIEQDAKAVQLTLHVHGRALRVVRRLCRIGGNCGSQSTS